MKVILVIYFLGVIVHQVKCNDPNNSSVNNGIIQNSKNDSSQVKDYDFYTKPIPGEENSEIADPSRYPWFPRTADEQFDIRTIRPPSSNTFHTTKITPRTNILTPGTCESFNSCGECVNNNKIKCNWCVQEHLCVTGTQCKKNLNSTQISHNSEAKNTNLKDSNGCPRILGFFPNLTHGIAVPWRGNSSFSLVAEILPQHFPKDVQFNCRFLVFTPFREYYISEAKLLGNKILCESVHFNIRQIYYVQNNKYEKDVDVDVIYKIPGLSWRKLDNPNKLKVYVTLCQRAGLSCKECLSIDRKYECSWCVKSRSCLSNWSPCPKDDQIGDKENCPARPEAHTH